MPHPHAKRFTLLLSFLVLAAILSGCSSQGSLVASSWPSVSADETTAYVAFNEAVYAIRLDSGVQRWRFPVQAERNLSFYAPPAIDAQGMVIIGSYNGAVFALTNDGNTKWGPKGSGGHIIGAPVIAGDMVLVPNSNGTLIAYDLETGAEEWTFDEAGGGLWAAPLVAGETVYVSSLDHHVYALDLQTGNLIDTSEDLVGAIADTPTLADDMLLVGTFNSQLVALDKDNLGSQRWVFDTAGWVWGSPTVYQGIVFFGDVTGLVYALDLQDGRALNWDSRLMTTVTASPVVIEGRIYFASATGLYTYDILALEDTEYSATEPLPATDPLMVENTGQILSDPVPAGEMVLVTSMNAERFLIAFDAASLVERWDFPPTTN